MLGYPVKGSHIQNKDTVQFSHSHRAHHIISILEFTTFYQTQNPLKMPPEYFISILFNLCGLGILYCSWLNYYARKDTEIAVKDAKIEMAKETIEVRKDFRRGLVSEPICA